MVHPQLAKISLNPHPVLNYGSLHVYKELLYKHFILKTLNIVINFTQ